MGTPGPLVRASIRLPRGLAERARKAAASEERSLANMIAVLLREALDARAEREAS